MKQSRRDYDNSLRNERAQMTRQKIMQALIDLAAHQDVRELSVSLLADKAHVSEPTVYRHFPDRVALLNGLQEQLDQAIQLPPLPDDLAELPRHIEELFLLFERDRKLLSAAFNSPRKSKVHLTLQENRLAQLRRAVSAMTPHLQQSEQARIFGVVQHLASALAWKSLHDAAGLAGGESGVAVAWALRALLKDAQHLNAQAERAKNAQCR